MSAPATRKVGAYSIVIAVVVCWILLSAMTHIVPAGHRGVAFSRVGGVKQTSLPEGFNLITPFIDRVTDYEVRSRTYVFTRSERGDADRKAGAVNAKDSDQQAVYLDLTLRYRLDPESVYKLHDQIGPEYEEKIIRVRTEDAARAIVASYKAEVVFSTKRQEIQDRLQADLAEVLLQNYVILDEVLIRNVAFTPEYQQKIEQKQIALQRAQMKGYELLREQKEKTRKTIEAKAEGEAIRITGEALGRYPSVVEYEFVSKIPDNVNTYVITGDTIVNLSDMFGPKAKPAPQPAKQ